MRALLFTSEEPLYLPRYLEPVFAAHADAIEAVVVANPPAPVHEQVRAQYRMFGRRAFVRLGAKYARGRLLDTFGDLAVRLTGRYHSVTRLARDHGVTVREVDDLSSPDFGRWVERLAPDLLLSVVCGQRVPDTVLEAATDAVNLHGSLLPKYRGRAVAFWPLYHGDDETGVTAHVMTDEWDAGPLIERRRVPVADDTYHSLSLKLADAGGDLAVDLLDRYPCKFDTRPNDTTDDDYRSLPSPAQRRAFLRAGHRFV